MKESDVTQVKQKSVRGIVALSSRTFLLQIIAFGSTFLLTIFLEPSIFGIFYVTTALIAFLNYFSDVGLAAALIQKKEELTREDLATTFTIQQVLVGTMTLVGLLLSSVIAHAYRLDQQGLVLLRILILSFFVSSLKTIPSILLERRLDFQTLIIPQILETVGFYLTAVFLAWRGYGITSFAWAVGIRAVVGLVAMYIVSPWQMSIGISRSVASRLLKFGIPFQLNSFLALVKDDLLTVFLGRVLSYTEVGYIGWAKKWAEVPLRLIMDSVIRVSFPAFSRLQESKELLTKAIEKTLFGISASIFPITVGLLFFVSPLVDLVPRYEKWQPALLSFFLFAIASAVSSLSTPLTNALNAVGKIKVTLWLMVLWTTLTWILTIAFIPVFGFDGVALALLLITATLILVVFLAKKITHFSFWASIKSPIFASILQAVVYAFLLTIIPGTAIWYVLAGLSGVILYTAVLWLLERTRITQFIQIFREIHP